SVAREDIELDTGEEQPRPDAATAYELRAIGGPPPKDDYAFVPRSPLLSIIQTKIEEYVETQEPSLIVAEALPDERRSLAGVPAVTDQHLRHVELLSGLGETRRWKAREVARPKWLFSDPRWLLTGIAIA